MVRLFPSISQPSINLTKGDGTSLQAKLLSINTADNTIHHQHHTHTSDLSQLTALQLFLCRLNVGCTFNTDMMSIHVGNKSEHQEN